MGYNDLWKPDRETQEALSRGNKARPKRKQKGQKQKAKKDQAKKQREKRERIRTELLSHFGLHKYATNMAICYQIHKKTCHPLPSNINQANKMMKEYWQSLNGSAWKKKKFITEDDFYRSSKWRELRYIALEKSGGACVLCGARASDGVQLHVDHIVPRSRNIGLQYSLDNLQVLCQDCNLGKSNFDDTDWRY